MRTSNCPPDTSKSMVFIPELKDSVNSWITDVIGYIKTPPDSGGIGDDKHLYQITYNGIETGNNALYGTFSNYYSLYNNSKLDIAGMSSYFDEKEMMKSRAKYAILLKDSFPQKPFHFDEGNSPGFILNDTKTTSTHYNNYDVTFHNELWASAFMGGFTTLGPWEGEVVHRWKHATREFKDSAYQMNILDVNFDPVVINDTIKSFYHNFKPLSDFISLIDFSQNYDPGKYYGDTNDYIETYYLRSTDSANVYGWVHNINKFWSNSFYWEPNAHDTIVENYYGCERSTQPDSVFILSGFKHNNTYYVYFFRTRIGSQIVPAADTIVSDSSGKLNINLSYSPLGCDSMNADYAYFISDVPHDWSGSRQVRILSQPRKEFNVSVIPNPSQGIFNISLSGNEAIDVCSIEVIDFSGKYLLTNGSLKGDKFRLNLSDKSKGIYFLKIKSGEAIVFRKIVIL